MRRLLLVPLVVCLVSAHGLAQESAVPEAWRAWVAEHDALPASHYRQPEDGPLRELLTDATREQVAAAVSDPDAELRALAALAAGWSDQPTLLALLRPLLDDDAATLAHRWIPAGQAGGVERLHVVEEAQTVSQVARRVLTEWLDGHQGPFEPFLDQVSTESGARSSVAVWHRRFRRVRQAPLMLRHAVVELGGGRATDTHAHHPSETEIAAKAAVRARLQREAPPLVYAVTLLSAPEFGEPVASPEHLHRIANDGLRRAHVFAILRGEPPFEDACLRPDGPGPYRRLCENLLRHREFGSADILDLEGVFLAHWDSHLRAPELHLALARACPSAEQARGMIERGLRAFPHQGEAHARGILIGEGWSLAGSSRTAWWSKLVLDARTPDRTVATATARVLETGGPAAREFAGDLIRDPRFDRLSWPVLVEIARGVDRLAGEEVVGEERLRQAWHPLGIIESTRLAAAQVSHPDETRELLLHLAAWRALLREYVDQAEW